MCNQGLLRFGPFIDYLLDRIDAEFPYSLPLYNWLVEAEMPMQESRYRQQQQEAQRPRRKHNRKPACAVEQKAGKIVTRLRQLGRMHEDPVTR